MIWLFPADEIFDLPEGWAEVISQASRTHGVRVESHGKGLGSLEGEETAGLDYVVLDGALVKEHLGWLYEQFAGTRALAFIGRLVGQQVYPDGHLESSINVNRTLSGGRYEDHVDPKPWTLLLYCNTIPAGMGGGLDVQVPELASRMTVQPIKGLCLLFDGSTHPHRVLPCAIERVSVPMIYATFPEDDRAAGYDAQLYGSKTEIL